MPKSIKSILVADYDIQLVSFLQERIRDRRIQFVLATHFDHIVDLLENETFFAAIVDFEFRNEKGAKVIDYVIAKTIPTIATINELTPECHKEILQYPVIDYVIKNNLAGKGYLADLLYGLEYFYNKKVLICYGNREPHITEELVSLFRSLLFRPIVAKSVTEALERLEHDESINIVYVDEDLNGEDGLGLCREIKYRFGRRDMILFGGADSLGHLFDFEKTKGEFLKSGVTDFFTRPIDKERFNTHILSMMKILKQKRRLIPMSRLSISMSSSRSPTSKGSSSMPVMRFVISVGIAKMNSSAKITTSYATPICPTVSMKICGKRSSRASRGQVRSKIGRKTAIFIGFR